jgi:O-antigen polymerase
MRVSHPKQIIFFALLVLLLLVAPFYFHFNIGGLGLALPYNAATWLAALVFSCVVIMTQLNTKTVVYNQAFLYCLIFPVVVILAGIASDVSQHIDWLFRQLFILGGFVFLFALFQTRLTAKQVDQLLYCLVISSLLQSIVSICQLHELSFLENVIPYSVNQVPLGFFQQVNVLASYLVTGLMIILFLISRPAFNSTHFLTKVFLVVTFGLLVYVVFSTGSRVGVLSFFVAGGLIVWSRWKQLARNKAILALLISVTLIGILFAQAGVSRVINKTENMTAGEYASARQTMYAVAGELITENPLLGYGIGSFQRVWVNQVTKFAAKHPEAQISQDTTSHPHNEILLWMIEGGLIALFALLVVLISIAHALYQCGFSRGGAYAALLLPITLHTQVELPFYISSVHWFVWLFLIFIVFRHQLKTTTIAMSQTAYYAMQTSILFISLTGAAILMHASKAQFEIAKYSSGKDGGGNLAVGLQDLYFNSYAEKLMMQNLLYSSIKQQDKSHIPLFIKWAEDRIAYKPEKGMFIMLNDAYGFNDDKINQCRIAKRGLAAYTKNERLQATVNDCQ